MNLHDCCKWNDLPKLQRLISDGANVNEKDHGLTSLHLASQSGYLEIVKILLYHGANINNKSLDGWSPLHFASYNGHLETLKFLITHRSLTGGLLLTNVNEKTDQGLNSLHLASLTDNLEIIKELLYHQDLINVNEKSDLGSTPLHLASSANNLKIVKELSKFSNVSIKNNHGETALDIAKTQEIRDVISQYNFTVIKSARKF